MAGMYVSFSTKQSPVSTDMFSRFILLSLMERYDLKCVIRFILRAGPCCQLCLIKHFLPLYMLGDGSNVQRLVSLVET